MLGKLHALICGLCAAAALVGCAEEYETPAPRIGPGAQTALRAAELRTIGAPQAPDLPFGEALITYSRQVGLIHAFQGEHADPQIYAAVLQLATILDRMPAAGAQPSLRRAAALVRAEMAASAPGEAAASTQRSLAVAATALLDLASGAYREMPEIAARARAFAGAVEAIDVTRNPPDRATVVDALVRAERVLASMYAANVRPPTPPARE